MTYLERITYLVGEVIELSQYAVKNAYRLNAYLQVKLTDKEFSTDRNIIAEDIAKKAYEKNINKSGKEIIHDLENSNLSVKIMNDLTSLLLKRDNLVNNFFIENGYSLSKEDMVVYNDIIAQLEEYSSLAKELNNKIANNIVNFDFTK